MKKLLKRTYLIILSFLLVCISNHLSIAQVNPDNFKKAQLSAPHVATAWAKYNDTVKKTFEQNNLKYPPQDIYIRAFKSQNEMELWARDDTRSEYKLVKTFHICALSGVLGPKRAKGDRQVPEGFYFISDFNAQSEYYLSMQVSYPNFSDSMLSGGSNLGGDIFIHGGCVTIGCMPMTDEGIKELYTLCLNAHINGDENIPVHIFPTRMNKNGMNYLYKQYGNDQQKMEFWKEMEKSYGYFEEYHKILPVMYAPDGKYAY